MLDRIIFALANLLMRLMRTHSICRLPLISSVLLAYFYPSLALAAPEFSCTYTDAEGNRISYPTLEQIPKEFQSAAKCLWTHKGTPAEAPKVIVEESPREEQPQKLYEFRDPRTGKLLRLNEDEFREFKKKLEQSGGASSLAKPSEMALEGTERREVISTPLGKMHLRWPRKIETLFGRTPIRAMADAARTVSRAIRRAGFPARVQNTKLEWQVVFLDENLSGKQIPGNLVSNCHPAWMTPPANIYIVGQRVAAGCGGGSAPRGNVADGKLASVLIHELGHAVEHYTLSSYQNRDPMHIYKMRAEGFASWFEQYGSDLSRMVKRGEVTSRYRAWARQSFKQAPDVNRWRFQGTPYDYARASMYFKAMQEKRGINGIMDVYETMIEKQIGFLDAVYEEFRWDHRKLDEEAQRLLR